MSKSEKISDFRTLDLSEKETTPVKKKAGVVSGVKKKKIQKSYKNINKPKKKEVDFEEFEEDVGQKKSHLGLSIFFIVLVVMGAVVGCMFTPVFDITQIVVQDGSYVTGNEILSKFDGIVGKNIMRVNLSSIKKDVQSMPYIKEVEIKRQLPDTLNVVYEERAPYALIKYLESFLVMDKYGYVLEVKKENDMPDLAIIYGIDIDKYEVGEKLEDVVGLKYENITYLLETSHKSEFDYTIYEINYADSEKLVMAVKDLDIDINFGEIDRSILTEKMIYLNGILKKLNGKKGNLDISSNNYLEKTIFTERY